MAQLDIECETVTPNRQDLPRRIGFWGGSAIMVGIIIGSGIFRTPTSIAQQFGSPAVILLLWLVGGLLSMAGAFTYAELGTMFPRSGGIYAFLYEGLGRQVAFVFGWSYIFLGKPMAISAITTVFAEHVNHLFGLHWDPRFVTCALIIALTAVNVVRVELGAGVAIVLTSLKALALGGIVVLGLALTQGSLSHFAPTASPQPFLAAIGPALAAILWTFDGWADVTFVAGEVREPHRLLPRIILAGTAGSVALFVIVNAVYIYMVPLNQMRSAATVAPLVMERICGSIGGTVVTVMVIISTLGAAHGSVITGARVIFAQARDGLFFRSLGRVHPRFQTPHVSLWLQALMACVAVCFLKHFERMIGGFVFTMWIFYAATAVSVILIRIRRPDLLRPYRCWGYPVVPLLFVLASALMTVLSIKDAPGVTLPWLGVLAVGVPVYYAWRWWCPPEPADHVRRSFDGQSDAEVRQIVIQTDLTGTA